MVGHSNLGFADALRRLEETGRLQYIGIRHEGAAAFAASAYGKLTGRPAACLGIAGPGSTNLLTGLYDAKVDRAPVVAVSGQVPSKVLGRGAFQDLDLSAAFVGRRRLLDRAAGRLRPRRARRAGRQARLDARSVAHLVLPDEVQVQASNQRRVVAGRAPLLAARRRPIPTWSPRPARSSAERRGQP